jgi:hypothetical protein
MAAGAAGQVCAGARGRGGECVVDDGEERMQGADFSLVT